jgi:lysophospholipase L1-like esterase
MLAALAVPYMTPRLRPFRVVQLPWESATLADDMPAIQKAWAAVPAATGQQMLLPSENTPTINNALPPRSNRLLPDIDPDLRATLHALPIVDPSGRALDAFFARLARTDRKEPGAITRILHYGDSTIASDYVSGTVRRRLQARFGDAGHGFLLIANPWEWYFHNDVFHASDGEWMASKLAGPTASDRMYGLGGVSFTSYGGGVASFGTATRGEYGRRASRFDVYYLEQPGGGDLELRLRGGAQERISTRAKGDAKVSRAHSMRVTDGESKLTLRAAGGGPVRLFGVAIERDVPGVVYDALGAHAAMAVYWQRQDRAHWREQLTLRDPALVVLQYGTNESDLWRLNREDYERALSELLDELKEIAPSASVLVVAPLDRAEQRGGRLLTKPVILDLVAIEGRVARAHGVAFWNTFEAMGGEGSMGRWARAKPQLGGGDLTHPTPLGAEILGDLLTDAILGAYDAWSQREYSK